jgi:hypothetical protein
MQRIYNTLSQDESGESFKMFTFEYGPPDLQKEMRSPLCPAHVLSIRERVYSQDGAG